VSALLQFRNALWRATLENALCAPFYRDFWKHADLDAAIARGPAGISLLPIVSKSMIQAAGAAARNAEGQPCIDTISSGTTGKPFVTKRGSVELDFISRFYAKAFPKVASSGIPRRRILSFDRMYHGSGVPIASDNHSHKVSIYDYDAFGYAYDVLSRPHDDQGVESWCTVVTGTERVIAAFLDDIERRSPALPCRVEMIVTSGSYVSRALRERARRLFNAVIVDRYSLSEVFGGATEDASTGWYRFDPCLYAEVVNPVTKQPVESGVGLLLLTALHPFQIVQPMVRYDTGDLVEVATLAGGEQLIRPKGRLRHAAIDEATGECLLAASEVYEIVEREPFIARRPLFLDAHAVADHFSCGLPKYALTATSAGSVTMISLSVETRDGADADSLTRRLTAAVVASSPPLAVAIDEGRASLEVTAASAVARPDFMWA
jgi:phenylacetate-coenzyme A ligase PaaK-like adenylate-forming protein